MITWSRGLSHIISILWDKAYIPYFICAVRNLPPWSWIKVPPCEPLTNKDQDYKIPKITKLPMKHEGTTAVAHMLSTHCVLLDANTSTTCPSKVTACWVYIKPSLLE